MTGLDTSKVSKPRKAKEDGRDCQAGGDEGNTRQNARRGQEPALGPEPEMEHQWQNSGPNPDVHRLVRRTAPMLIS